MNNTVIFLLIPLTLLSSCIVSKQKYDELQLTSDMKIEKLNGQIDKLIEDYNLMRNDLANSNAKKDLLIDEVSKKVFGLSTDQEEIKDELETIKDRYKWAKHENKQKDKTISGLNSKISRLQKVLDENKLNLDNTLSQNTQNVNSLKEKIRRLEKQNKLYKTQLERLKDKLNNSMSNESKSTKTIKSQPDTIN